MPAALASAPFGAAAASADRPLVLENAQAGVRAAQRYWTPDRLARARPMTPAVSAAPRAAPTPRGASPGRSRAAVPPVRAVAPDLGNRLFEPADAPGAPEPAQEAAGGVAGAAFTSSRLVGAAVHTKFPYSAVGKLFFTQPGVGDFVCSASVVAPRVVVTAGHCVHAGAGGAGGFHQNFQFVPALKNGVAPFGTWTWAYAVVTATWASGGGAVPNAADYAMLEMADAAPAGRIGDVTGALGFQTLRLEPNHATLLGYPCNLDQCRQMHQVTAASARAVAPNNVEYGADARGGQSGGPWIQDFGRLASGQETDASGPNRVIGVVSYMYASPSPKLLGGSIPDARWVELFNLVCAHRAGNC